MNHARVIALRIGRDEDNLDLVPNILRHRGFGKASLIGRKLSPGTNAERMNVGDLGTGAQQPHRRYNHARTQGCFIASTQRRPGKIAFTVRVCTQADKDAPEIQSISADRSSEVH
jgi:hypothetical protein